MNQMNQMNQDLKDIEQRAKTISENPNASPTARSNALLAEAVSVMTREVRQLSQGLKQIR